MPNENYYKIRIRTLCYAPAAWNISIYCTFIFCFFTKSFRKKIFKQHLRKQRTLSAPEFGNTCNIAVFLCNGKPRITSGHLSCTFRAESFDVRIFRNRLVLWILLIRLWAQKCCDCIYSLYRLNKVSRNSDICRSTCNMFYRNNVNRMDPVEFFRRHQYLRGSVQSTLCHVRLRRFIPLRLGHCAGQWPLLHP